MASSPFAEHDMKDAYKFAPVRTCQEVADIMCESGSKITVSGVQYVEKRALRKLREALKEMEKA